MNFVINKYQFELPGEWQQGDATKIDANNIPGFSGYYTQQTETYFLQLIAQTVPADHIDYIPAFDTEAMIRNAHEKLGDMAGLIEVSLVKTMAGQDLLRSIIKESVNHLPIYTSKLYYRSPDGSGFIIQLVAREKGMTGTREAMVLASNLPQEMTKTTDSATSETITQGAPIPGWAADPYDSEFKKGFLMNKSEDAMFDQQFPKHPLSVLRADLELIQNSLTEKRDSQTPFTQQEAALQSYTNTGSPSAAPTMAFVPSNEQRSKFQPIKQPRTISVNWFFDSKEREKFEYGHKAQTMEDKWNIYCEDNVVHFHRSWTGNELFRFKLSGNRGFPTSSPDQKPSYTFGVTSFEVEQDPEIYKETDEQAIKDMLGKVLQFVLGVSPSSLDETKSE